VLVARRLVAVTALGRLDLQAADAIVAHGLGGLDAGARRAALFDLRRAQCALSLGDVSRLVESLSCYGPRTRQVRVAVLAEGAAHTRQKLDFFCDLAQRESYQVRPFDDAESASVWTGADVPAALSVLLGEAFGR